MYHWIVHHRQRHQYVQRMLGEIHKYVFPKFSQALFFAQNGIRNQIRGHFCHYQLHFIVDPLVVILIRLT